MALGVEARDFPAHRRCPPRIGVVLVAKQVDTGFAPAVVDVISPQKSEHGALLGEQELSVGTSPSRRLLLQLACQLPLVPCKMHAAVHAGLEYSLAVAPILPLFVQGFRRDTSLLLLPWAVQEAE